MAEAVWDSADGFESVFFPEADGGLVGGDDEVELHGEEAGLFGGGEGVLAHLGSKASTTPLASDHVAGVGYVVA